ncbi:MAG: hypothetical protein GY868_16595 [Deltaproteobacteria bacterium]|nr:hypothetical protein [Deltaproteobacteria bacterium]
MGYAIKKRIELRSFIFFGGQRKRSKRKAAPDVIGTALAQRFAVEGPKTRFAQIVWPLGPQQNTSLGCVAMGF